MNAHQPFYLSAHVPYQILRLTKKYVSGRIFRVALRLRSASTNLTATSTFQFQDRNALEAGLFSGLPT